MRCRKQCRKRKKCWLPALSAFQPCQILLCQGHSNSELCNNGLKIKYIHDSLGPSILPDYMEKGLHTYIYLLEELYLFLQILVSANKYQNLV